jgi:hypothetical protein
LTRSGSPIWANWTAILDAAITCFKYDRSEEVPSEDEQSAVGAALRAVQDNRPAPTQLANMTFQYGPFLVRVDPSRAIALLSRSRDLAASAGADGQADMARLALIGARTAAGQPAHALAEAVEVLESFRRSANDFCVRWALALCALALHQLGRADSAALLVRCLEQFELAGTAASLTKRARALIRQEA